MRINTSYSAYHDDFFGGFWPSFGHFRPHVPQSATKFNLTARLMWDGVEMAKKDKITKSSCGCAVAVPLPRLDVTDGEIVAAVVEKGGLPTRVADKFGMSLADLKARAKASAEIVAAFAEARQRQVDNARVKAYVVAMGDANTPPDTSMLRWYIERYE